MTDERLLEIIRKRPDSLAAAIVIAYQLGRYFGRNEHRARFSPRYHNSLCEFVAERTERLIAWAQNKETAC